MTALSRTPQNTNFLQPTKFMVVFDRISTVQYFCQTANIPGVTLGEATINTPLVDLPAPGTKLTYAPFSMNFLVDENLTSYQQLLNWFNAIASPKSMDERNLQSALQNAQSIKLRSYSDATLTVYSALNNPLVRIQYHNMFPTSLSDINFDSKNSADEMITADAIFRYDYYEILPA